ncbi:hypothetical protein IQ249_05920 [Lusitaniella coriacea LEGE 07157]|uniref:HEAT repeat domain-containing protein n=1 Tax=Lusitaniella coriacea LEGE 07157 TaxID=945747 RepID=A0A8J7DP01_9CYAN|nr:hypothetical protein [Lusitaniella coriacea]MBE9115434.1 hypothetical protein [Lusitaniella coriacea LEGE 07157]
MANSSNSPKAHDAVLGGQSPPPVDGVTLGGIEGLRQRFAVGNCEQKIKMLPTALNYGEAGIDFLIEVLNDPTLRVRATAYNVLQDADIEQAKSEILQGFLLHQGDRIYSVYESYLFYNDWCYDLITYAERIDYIYGFPVPFVPCLSRHIFRSSAEIAAKLHHDWRAIQEDICSYFTQIGWDDSSDWRREFNIIEWCKNNNILIRLPQEEKANFKTRLMDAGYANDLSNCTLNEEMEFLLQELMRFDEREEEKISHLNDDLEEIEWEIRHELETKTIRFLQVSQCYELLSQLWLDAIGQLTFIHEETIEEEIYIIPTGKL